MDSAEAFFVALTARPSAMIAGEVSSDLAHTLLMIGWQSRISRQIPGAIRMLRGPSVSGCVSRTAPLRDLFVR